MTGLLIINAIALAVILMIIIQHKRFLDSYRQELLYTLQESKVVRSDLENLLTQAVKVSSDIAARLECHSVATIQSNSSIGGNSNDLESSADSSPADMLHESRSVLPSLKKKDEADGEMPLLYHQVVGLHKQGYSIKDIASTLNRGQGEVSLILNITNKRRVV